MTHIAGALLQIDTHVQAGEMLEKISSALAILGGQDDLDTAPAPSSLDQHLPQIQQIADQVRLSTCAAERATLHRGAVGFPVVILTGFR